MLRTALTATGLALAGGFATLAIGAAGPAGAQAEFSISLEQLKINQRISQAGVRRSNEALARLDMLEARVNAPAPAAPQPQQPQQPQQLPGPGLANDVPPPPPPRVSGNATVAPGETGAAEASCPSSFILGHGGYLLPSTAVGAVYESLPLQTSAGWRVAFRNDGTVPVTVTAYAACARP
jgi:hypothetical protein